MKKVSVSLESHHVERLDERQENSDVDSRSGALRQILDEYDELRTECENLRAECDDLRTDVERLQEEKRLILTNQDTKRELVEYVEEERNAEQQWREAGLLTKAKWSVFGMPG